MSLYLHKSHNVSCLIYHIVCPTKYRRIVISKHIDQTIKSICLEIAKRYDIHFLEIGADKDYAHFLVQSVPMMLPKNIVQTIKSITARMVLKKHIRKLEKISGEARFGLQAALSIQSAAMVRNPPLPIMQRIRALKRVI